MKSDKWFIRPKKLLAAALSVIISICCIPPAAFADNGNKVTDGEFEYEELRDGSLAVVGYMGEGGNVIIPSESLDKKVTRIEYPAFMDCASLTSVKIPDSITEISIHAFCGCASLSEVNVSKFNEVFSSRDGVLFNKDMTCLLMYPVGKRDKKYALPDSVETIGAYGFSRCSSLTSIEISKSVTEIGQYAFEGCSSLTSADIPEGVEEIYMCTFKGCAALTSVVIPNTVTAINYGAFKDCTSLTSIEIPDSVEKIFTDEAGKDHNRIPGAFSGCTSLAAINVSEENEYLSSVDGVLFNKDKTDLIAYPVGKKDKNYIIPIGVTCIADEAFSECSLLTSVEFPDTVTDIGNSAFNGCASLTLVTITDSVVSICEDVFADCSDSLVIYGYTDSCAEVYAKECEMTFIPIDDSSKIQVKDGIAVTVPDGSDATLEGKSLKVEQESLCDNSVSYNIILTDTNEKTVQPGGMVNVKIPVPSSWDGKICRVYHTDSEAYIDMNARYYNGCMFFATDHFSIYVLSSNAAIDDGVEETADSEEFVMVSTTSSSLSDSAEKGDDENKKMSLMMTSVPLVLIAVIAAVAESKGK